MGSTVSTLKELVSPLSEGAFMTLLRERELLHLRASDPERYSSLLNWDTLVGMLERGDFPRGFAEVRVAKESVNAPFHVWQTRSKVNNSAQIDLAKVEELMGQSYSLIVTPVELHAPSLTALCDDIRSHLSEKIKVGAVVTTGSGGAFRLHFDPEDLIILQLEGTKRWQIFGPPVSNPVIGMPDQTAPDTPPLFDEVLQPGDFLFLPAGNWHHCQNGPGRSLHLGIFFIPPTGWNAATTIASQLVAEEIFRKPLTRVESPCELAALETELKSRLIEKIGQLKLHEFIAEWNKPKKREPLTAKEADRKVLNEFLSDWNK